MNNITELAKAIEHKEACYIEAKEHELKYLASIYRFEFNGLIEAFEIVYGISYSDYLSKEE